MNVKITYTNGATSIAPVSDSATVKFTWHTVSKDGHQRSDNEQAFALADIAALELVEDAPALAADVHAAADPASEAASGAALLTPTTVTVETVTPDPPQEAPSFDASSEPQTISAMPDAPAAA